MPAIKQDAYTSGRVMWNEHKHKRADLVGLKVDNQSASVQKISLYDLFTTNASKAGSDGSAQAAEDFASHVLSGKVRFQTTVPVGESISYGKEDLEDVTFLGKAYVVAGVESSDCIVIAQYRLR